MINVSLRRITTAFVILMFFSVVSVSAAAKYNSLDVNEISSEYRMSAGIDSLDTIYFDLRSISTVGSAVEIPVYFKSDDVVYAMDFSFMYNDQLFNFDSITSVQSNFQYLFNYAPFDSTVYFTSYSLGAAYQNNANVVKTRFNLLGSLQSLSVNDVHHALGYLNGDVCPVKIIPPSLTGFADVDPVKFDMFPNPATALLTILPGEDGVICISDVAGKQLSHQVNVYAGQQIQLDISSYVAGVYLVSLKSAAGRSGQTRLIVLD